MLVGLADFDDPYLQLEFPAAQTLPPPCALVSEPRICVPWRWGSLVGAGLGADWKSLILGVWAAQAGPNTRPTGGPLGGPPIGGVFGLAGAAQTPKIGDFRLAPKPAPTKDTQRLGTQIRCSDCARRT